MTDNLQTKLIQWAEKIGDIASEQLPDFANQIIAYEMYTACIWWWVCASFLAVIVFLFLCIFACYLLDKEFREDGWCIMVILMFAAIFPSIGLGSNYIKLKKCEVAPKLVIVDYIKG